MQVPDFLRAEAQPKKGKGTKQVQDTTTVGPGLEEENGNAGSPIAGRFF